MMKRSISLLLTICIIWTLTSCGNGSEPTLIELIPPIVPPMEIEQQEANSQQEEIPEVSDGPFEGKIAVITNVPVGGLSYYSAFPILAGYGEENVFHKIWPVTSFDEGIIIIEELINNSNVKVIIANPLDYRGIEGFERLRETREDIFLVFRVRDIGELSEQLMEIADLILLVDEIATGPAMVRQAYKMGAETFVYYSRVWSQMPIEIERRNLIEQECAELGIRFIEVTIPEAITWEGEERRRFFRDDVQRIVQNYGENTAFFSSSMIDFLWSVIEFGGIFPQPNDLLRSPFNAVLDRFDLFSMSDEDFVEIHLSAEKSIELTRRFLDEHNMLGRVSNWPIPYEFLFTHAATEYAIKRLNGEVPKDGIDVDALKKIMEDFAGVNVYLAPFTDLETGITHDHVLMMRMGYFIY